MTDGSADAGTADASEPGGAGTSDAEPAASGDDDGYAGLLGAFPYGFRVSESRLFRAYAAVGGLLAALVVVLFALALVVLLGQTAAASGGTFTFSRAFLLVVMVLVVVPLVAPVLFVARRHRRIGSTAGYDRALAATGFGFLGALYLGLVISTPESLRSPVDGPLGPVVSGLYALPRAAGVVPPVAAAVLIYAVHRRLR